MESRKSQLQKQIIKALEAKDDDLYSLLKSQWAHRFGVESLEELKNLDLNHLNESSTNQVDEKIDQSEETPLESDEPISVKDDNKEKEIKTEEYESINHDNDESSQVKSYEIVDKENNEKKYIKPSIYNRSQQEVSTLIPLAPKPKYGYLKKWLLSK